jgi:IstB-like ATP binding protein
VDLVESLRRLKLSTMREQAAEVLQTAKTQRWGAEDVLRTLLDAEIVARDAANRRIRLKQAGFPVPKTLEAFDVPDSSIPRPTFDYIASLERAAAALLRLTESSAAILEGYRPAHRLPSGSHVLRADDADPRRKYREWDQRGGLGKEPP